MFCWFLVSRSPSSLWRGHETIVIVLCGRYESSQVSSGHVISSDFELELLFGVVSLCHSAAHVTFEVAWSELPRGKVLAILGSI